MTQVLNLDSIEKLTVKLSGKEYELYVPGVDEYEEWEKVLTSKEFSIENIEDIKKVAKKLFVKPPSDEVLGAMKLHQFRQLQRVAIDLMAGNDTYITDSKKK